MFRFSALLLSTLLLTACASALGDAQQEITILTPGANDSVCYINNGDVKYRAWPPQTILISKRSGDLEVECLADGNRRQKITVDQQATAVTLGNAMNGFTGMFVDHFTGAMYEYPNEITVDFTQIAATKEPLPYYHKHLMENPDLYGMEEFRAGRAALMRDKYHEDYVLEKRDFSKPGTYDEFKTVVSTGDSSESSEAETSSSDSGESTSFVSDLTKQMNPQVFGSKSEAASSGEGFVGGTSSPTSSDSTPTKLSP